MYDIEKYRNETLTYLNDITKKFPKGQEKKLLIFRFSDSPSGSDWIDDSQKAGIICRLITYPQNVSYKEARSTLNGFYYPGHIDGIVVEKPNTGAVMRLLEDIPREVDVMG